MAFALTPQDKEILGNFIMHELPSSVVLEKKDLEFKCGGRVVLRLVTKSQKDFVKNNFPSYLIANGRVRAYTEEIRDVCGTNYLQFGKLIFGPQEFKEIEDDKYLLEIDQAATELKRLVQQKGLYFIDKHRDRFKIVDFERFFMLCKNGSLYRILRVIWPKLLPSLLQKYHFTKEYREQLADSFEDFGIVITDDVGHTFKFQITGKIIIEGSVSKLTNRIKVGRLSLFFLQLPSPDELVQIIQMQLKYGLAAKTGMSVLGEVS